MKTVFDKVASPTYNRDRYKQWLAKHPNCKNVYAVKGKAYRQGNSTQEDGAMLKHLADIEQLEADKNKMDNLWRKVMDSEK